MILLNENNLNMFMNEYSVYTLEYTVILLLKYLFTSMLN